MKKKLLTGVLLAVLVLALILYGFARLDRPPEAASNEILLKIRLDLEEDIGLFLIDHCVAGEEGSGGISNADKSMLRRDDVLYWSFEKGPDDPAETAEVTVRFTVVTEYADPNYDNIYPEETMIPLEPISFSARYGEIYSIRIEGDKLGGYRAFAEGGE